MTTPEVIRLLSLLMTEHPRETIDDDRIKLWSSALADVALADALTAAAAWFSDPEKGRFFPKTGEFVVLCGRPARNRLYHRYSQLRNADELSPAEEAEFSVIDAALFGRGAFALDQPAAAPALGSGR